MYELRPYQVKALEALRQEFRIGHKRVCLVAIMGAGKTVIASHIIQGAIDKLKQVLFVAHRREILFQTSEKLQAAGVDHGMILAGMRPSILARVNVASIQTLARRDHPPADLIVIDEFHHAAASSYVKLLANYPDAFVIGLTATPCRGDGRGLGNVAQSIVTAAYPSELVDLGYLVPVEVYAPSLPDLNGIKIKRGDYDEKQLSAAVDKPKLIGDIVSHWHRLASDRKTILFATGIAHSQHLIEAFRASGVIAEHLDGETPHFERKHILDRYRSGQTQLISNVGVLTEGFDEPGTSCIVLARPTRSYGLYLQMTGRGLRPAEGKKNLLVLDHSGAVHEHGLPTDDRDWTLCPDMPASTQKKPTEKHEAQAWTCPSCFYLNPPGTRRFCDKCGMAAVAVKNVSVAEGQLKRIESVKPLTQKDKARIWNDCIYSASFKNLKCGAAAHMYRKKTGVWPRGFDPMPNKQEWKMSATEFLKRSSVAPEVAKIPENDRYAWMNEPLFGEQH